MILWALESDQKSVVFFNIYFNHAHKCFCYEKKDIYVKDELLTLAEK